MSILLFIIVLAASFIIVRIGAIAFQLTGLEWSLAKFQALSCFSGTGFTTREAELITGNPQRRRIATILIVLGNAGLVTMIASVASALNAQQALWARLSESFLPAAVPSYLIPWVNLVLIVAAVFVLYKIFSHPKLMGRLTASLRKRIIKKKIFRPVSFEELLLIAEGYGITKVAVSQASWLIEKSLSESRLREKGVTVLAITRADSAIPNPSADAKILQGDELICFGRLQSIKDAGI
jgi:hypothetical protein